MHVNVVRDRHPLLLRELAEQARGPGEQREAAQHGERQPEVGEHRAAHARAVERQRPAKDLRVHPTDRFEQLQVWAAHAFFRGDLDQPGGARVADLVHRVADAWDELLRSTRLLDGVQGERVEPGVVGGDLACFGQDGGQVLAAVLGHPEEPRPAAEQPGGDRTLQRVRGGQIG